MTTFRVTVPNIDYDEYLVEAEDTLDALVAVLQNEGTLVNNYPEGAAMKIKASMYDPIEGQWVDRVFEAEVEEA